VPPRGVAQAQLSSEASPASEPVSEPGPDSVAPPALSSEASPASEPVPEPGPDSVAMPALSSETSPASEPVPELELLAFSVLGLGLLVLAVLLWIMNLLFSHVLILQSGGVVEN
jgi:hypothetical protein